MRLFTNNADSTLAAPVSNVALSIQVAAGEGDRFPSPTGGDYFNLTLCKVTGGVENTIEIVQVTARSDDILTIVRAQEGTTAGTYTTGDRVSLRFTAAPANEFADHVADDANPHATTAVQVGAEPTITGGTTAQYWRGDKTWRDFFTDVRAATLTGLSTATNAVVTAADTVLVAIGLLQKQITDLTTTVSGKIDSTFLDTDVTLAANSDTKIATQKAMKAYADGLIAANDAMVFKGVIDCSANPNYPAADRGWTYRVSVAGKIGGASGPNVEVGDILLCLTDSTASGNHATVGANWSIIQVNIDGALTTAAIGVTVQAYDVDTAKLDVAQSWTAQQTFKELKDTVHTITDGAAFEIDPVNGSVQTVTLGANRTPAATNFEAGQTVLLGIDDGTAYTITWTTVNPTWVKPGGTASAPALATTGFTWVLLWKVGSTVYGAEVGKP